MPTLDLLISGGEVIDGSGARRRRADVGIVGDRIMAVAEPGALAAAGAAEPVDAGGMVVCPGFIDIMSHSLWPLFVDGRSLSKLVQGVTTEMMGEGYSPAPFGGLVGDPVPSTDGVAEQWLERIRGWRRFGDWLEALEASGVSPNVGLVHRRRHRARVRLRHACGRRPRAEELAMMRGVVADAMRDGAIGVAYALIYPPDAYASTDEIVEVAGEVAAAGGMYVSHIRSESERLLEGLDEAIAIGRRSGATTEIYHLKASGGPANWHLMAPAIERIEAARAEGMRLAADMYPYAASGTGLTARLPVSLAEDGKLFARLAEPGVREWVRDQLARGTDEVDDAGTARDDGAGRHAAARAPAVTSAATWPRSPPSAARTGSTTCSTC